MEPGNASSPTEEQVGPEERCTAWAHEGVHGARDRMELFEEETSDQGKMALQGGAHDAQEGMEPQGRTRSN